MNNTVSHITDGVRVSVYSVYQPSFSFPHHHVFAYKVTIENASVYTLQLMRRHWYVIDTNGVTREVAGEGVIGKQPILEPGEIYEYVSGCNLNTEIGMMKGNYQMTRIMDGRQVKIQIPSFVLIAPYRLN